MSHGCRGLRSGHQADAIAKMESLGVQVTVSTLDVVELAEAKELIAMTEAKAPLAGIFNLALNLDDRLMAQQVRLSAIRCCPSCALGILTSVPLQTDCVDANEAVA